MKRFWIEKDPECGYQPRCLVGTEHRYEDTGWTLMEEYPEGYFKTPLWAVMVFNFTARIHGFSHRLLRRWDEE